MREIVSILMECSVPLVTKHTSASAISQEVGDASRLEFLLNTFHRAVAANRPPTEVAYRCMKSELWQWAAATIDHVDGVDQCVKHYTTTLRAARNAERLFHIWRATSALSDEMNFVVERAASASGGEDVMVTTAEERPTKLADWFFIGLATEEAQVTCRKVLCRRMAETCRQAQHVKHLLDLQGVFRQVVTSALMAGDPCDEALSRPTELKKEKVKSRLCLNLYRNMVEAPLLESFAAQFSNPLFFGWQTFSSASVAEKRRVGLILLDFAKSCLHETTWMPLMQMFLGTVWADCCEVIHSETDFATRLKDSCPTLLFDVCCLKLFGSAQQANGLRLVGRGVQSLIVSHGISVELGQLRQHLVGNLDHALDSHGLSLPSIARTTFGKAFDEAFECAAKSWGGRLTDELIKAVHCEIVDLKLPVPSEGLCNTWRCVRSGVDLDAFESAYLQRVLQRCVVVNPPACGAVELAFAETILGAIAQQSTRLLYRVREVVKDLHASRLSSDALHAMWTEQQSTLPAPSAVFITSQLVARDFLSKSLPPVMLMPRAAAGLLEIASLAYNTLHSAPRNRQVTWLPHRSVATVGDRLNGKTLVMTLAHLAVLEQVDAAPHHQLAMVRLAEATGCPARVVGSFVEDLSQAGVLRIVRNSVMRSTAFHLQDACDIETVLCDNDWCLASRSSVEHSTVDVLQCSAKRNAALRKRFHDASKHAIECALLKLFKSGVALPFDGKTILPLLSFPSLVVVDDRQIHNAVARLVERQYLTVDSPTNTVTYLA